MNRRFTSCLIVALGTAFASTLLAEPLTSATIAEIRNNVSYQAAQDKTERPAKTGEVVRDADVVRTGERSLAELEFNDKTITRIGSKSVFSFRQANREFEVVSGQALICMPKGSGGGRILAPSITAAIQGTTVLVIGDAIIFLEGSGIISTRDGRQSKPIHGGQVVRLVDGMLVISAVALEPLLRSSLLSSRSQPLPTWAQIQDVASDQQGGAGSTGPGLPRVNNSGASQDGVHQLHPPSTKSTTKPPPLPPPSPRDP